MQCNASPTVYVPYTERDQDLAASNHQSTRVPSHHRETSEDTTKCRYIGISHSRDIQYITARVCASVWCVCGVVGGVMWHVVSALCVIW